MKLRTGIIGRIFNCGQCGRAFSQHFKRDFAECGHCGRCGRAFSQHLKLDKGHLRTPRTGQKTALSAKVGVLLPFNYAGLSYCGQCTHPTIKDIVGMGYIGGSLHQIASIGKRPSAVSAAVRTYFEQSTGRLA